MPSSGSKHWVPINRRRWARVRREALDRDDWRCQELIAPGAISTSTQIGVNWGFTPICGKAGRLEVHHIKPLEHGGKPFELSNLRTLCREHHIRIHGGEPHTVDPGYAALVQELLA